MGGEPLGRVLDPDALADAEGARGRHRIEIPAGWATCNEEIVLFVPLRLVCARCDGGGCDGCGRSGVVRGPDDPEARRIRVRLSSELGEGFALRISQPFGESGTIQQIVLEIRSAAVPSQGVHLVARSVSAPLAHPPLALSPAQLRGIFLAGVLLAIAVTAFFAYR